jgi:ABC-type nitrate/sulfonate/bicarbonate transport system ATPase subunit
MTVLAVQNVAFSYRQSNLLKNITFTLNKGEVVSIIGRSGSGKTTLFRILAGLEKPSSGTLHLHTSLSYMTQNTMLLPWRTLLDNLMLLNELGAYPRVLKSEFERDAKNFLAEVGLQESLSLYPHQISGGMQSRVALARILLEGSELMLLDEPFAFLDAITKFECQELILNIKNKFTKTIILVTHDIDEALRISDKVLLLSQGELINSWGPFDANSDYVNIKKEILSFLK